MIDVRKSENGTNGNKYPVKITETLEKVVYVEAESKDEAWERLKSYGTIAKLY